MISEKSIYLIRHGESEFNLAVKKANENKGNELYAEDASIRFVTDHIDCGLSETGKEQSENAATAVKDLDIKHVFCSPLRRAIQTAKIIFKNHKNRPKIIALPAAREIQASNCDIGSSVEVLEKEFPDVDFTHVRTLAKPHVWFLHHVPHQTLRDDLLAKTYEDPVEEAKKAQLTILESMKNTESLEDWYALQERTIAFKEHFKKLISALEGEVCLVGHFMIFKMLTSTEYDPKTGNPTNGKRFANAEVCYYPLLSSQKEEELQKTMA
jgi:broad specificity phosphatase PhoE